MAKMFISNNNRLHAVIGIERACDICSTNWKGITGIICQDAQTGNIWVSDIQYFNPLKGDKKAWRMLMLMDKYNKSSLREITYEEIKEYYEEIKKKFDDYKTINNM